MNSTSKSCPGCAEVVTLSHAGNVVPSGPYTCNNCGVTWHEKSYITDTGRLATDIFIDEDGDALAVNESDQ